MRLCAEAADGTCGAVSRRAVPVQAGIARMACPDPGRPRSAGRRPCALWALAPPRHLRRLVGRTAVKNAHEGRPMSARCLTTITAIGVIFAFAGRPGHAQGNIEAKVQLCAVCHGASGVPNDPKTVPNIWGQQSYYLFKQ